MKTFSVILEKKEREREREKKEGGREERESGGRGRERKREREREREGQRDRETDRKNAIQGPRHSGAPGHAPPALTPTPLIKGHIWSSGH